MSTAGPAESGPVRLAGSPHPERFNPAACTRPDDALLISYLIGALFTLVLFPITFGLLYLRYKSIRYHFDEDGVSMKVGVLVRQETNLTYRRIQDIHVISNIIERWLGIARVAVQTASGSAGPEMVIVGVRDPEALRDYLYNRMRGARGDAEEGPMDTPSAGGSGFARATDTHTHTGFGDPVAASASPLSDEALTLLREIRDTLAADHRQGRHAQPRDHHFGEGDGR